MLSIALTGDESPGFLRAMKSALVSYVDSIIEEYVEDQGASALPGNVRTAESFDTMPAALPPAATEKPTRKKRTPAAEAPAPHIESPETATREIHASELAAALEDSQDSGKAVADVKIEDIRAVARLFSTDETRPFALEILTKYGASSVTALSEMDNAVRVAALADFQEAAKNHNLG
ncbi:hypothetical protein [Paraburkholderia youngii]|uniref:hypothetical protein n=1 Tax=Paraburkholderia youngii TaxID=2782701 RepID=UPI00158FB79D|nr:hypothetical protein [Paraburkholderia youngii]NUX58690.1 hypothetical protein [Paraburkholderia youngii]